MRVEGIPSIDPLLFFEVSVRNQFWKVDHDKVVYLYIVQKFWFFFINNVIACVFLF